MATINRDLESESYPQLKLPPACGWLFAAILICFMALPVTASPVTVATLPVGDTGNAADTRFMSDNGTTGYGSIAYNYRIGKYDVTNSQYVEFLNAKAAAGDPYGLYDDVFSNDGSDGILRSGTTTFTYSLKPGMANKPANLVSWYDSLRFANWMTNGQGSGDTESGSYTISGGGNDSGTVTLPTAAQRAAWASNTTGTSHWLIPTENEWYKAAYYKGGGSNTGYWRFPFRSDDVPSGGPPPGGSNSGNIMSGGVFALFPSNGYIPTRNYVSDVGAYTNSKSPYGAYDMGGNVRNWLENSSGSNRATRGGDWFNDYDELLASHRSYFAPTYHGTAQGFRMVFLSGLIVGDMDGNGRVDNFDIQPFELALTDPSAYETTYAVSDHHIRGDIDRDGDLDNFDIDPFEALLASGAAAAVPEPSSFVLAGVSLTGLGVFARRRRR